MKSTPVEIREKEKENMQRKDEKRHIKVSNQKSIVGAIHPSEDSMSMLNAVHVSNIFNTF